MAFIITIYSYLCWICNYRIRRTIISSIYLCSNKFNTLYRTLFRSSSCICNRICWKSTCWSTYSCIYTNNTSYRRKLFTTTCNEQEDEFKSDNNYFITLSIWIFLWNTRYGNCNTYNGTDKNYIYILWWKISFLWI